MINVSKVTLFEESSLSVNALTDRTTKSISGLIGVDIEISFTTGESKEKMTHFQHFMPDLIYLLIIIYCF